MQKHRGVTLLELLIALTILALLVGLSGPAMQDFIDRQRANATAQQVLRQLNSARLHAVKSGHRVIFCGADTELNCTRDDVRQFIVFEDQNRNQRRDPGEPVHSIWSIANGSNAQLRPSLGLSYATFNPDGSARQAGSVIICSVNGNPQHIRRVTVSLPGRVYRALPEEGGLVRNANGTPIDCTM